VSWDRPLAKRCPQCDAAFVVQKVSRAGVRLRCLADGCGWTAEPDADAEIRLHPTPRRRRSGAGQRMAWGDARAGVGAGLRACAVRAAGAKCQ